jgi:hypothetical protein
LPLTSPFGSSTSLNVPALVQLLLFILLNWIEAHTSSPMALTSPQNHADVRVLKHHCYFGLNRLWITGESYCDPGVDYYEQKYQELMLSKLQKKAQALGLELVPKSTLPSRVS